uniref:Uncharacterized GST-like protein yfcF n=1 Tax=Erwinia amylovora ATCC BAA-2158 TaxID=889211 RepID=E5B728_ERWAM|nr:Uncharacterized GST-like protein yfcF [Erwinia amylovora ATCC BAA-2158]
MLNCPALHNDLLPQRLADCAHFQSQRAPLQRGLAVSLRVDKD